MFASHTSYSVNDGFLQVHLIKIVTEQRIYAKFYVKLQVKW